MSKTLLVVAAEAHYFPLAQDALQSILDKPERSQIALGFLDLGCTESQREWVQARVDRLERVNWDDFTAAPPVNIPDSLKFNLARPFLYEYFPGFEVYLWLDADAWVQNWAAIALMQVGARVRKGLAIVPELHRHASVLYDGRLPQVWERLTQLSPENLGYRTPLNMGVFALHVDAPHWAAWQQQVEALVAQKVFHLRTDQMAMHGAIYQNPKVFAQTEMLPSWCNTLPTAAPAWDEARQQWVERYLPYKPIGILHLAGPDKPEVWQATTLSGKTTMAPARYRLYRQKILGLA
jgi:hypothetical protein